MFKFCTFVFSLVMETHAFAFSEAAGIASKPANTFLTHPELAALTRASRKSGTAVGIYATVLSHKHGALRTVLRDTMYVFRVLEWEDRFGVATWAQKCLGRN